MSNYKEALFDILECSSLYVAKEIAADALNVELDDFIQTIDDSSLFFEDEEEDICVKDILSQFE